MSHRIIVVDDDRDYLELVKSRLSATGFPSVEILDDPLVAAAAFESHGSFDVALIDLSMPEMDGQVLLDLIKKYSPTTECIMVTAVNDDRTAVQCLRQGAYDYLVKPVSEDDLLFAVKRALERKRLLDILHIEKSRRLPVFSQPDAFREILTRCPSLLRILKEAELHAASDVPILITGESGTGKELLARAIHRASPRAAGPFLPLNMAALTADLFEAEFFGHTRGAFTGADKERRGHLKHCDHGTLFLDEIGNLPFSLQGKLLRVLQDGEFTPVGCSASQKADVRFVAATNEDLDQMVESGRFRRDLFYRIRGSWLHLPSLQERKEDIPLLIEHFLKELGRFGDSLRLDAGASETLMGYEFPGNIRELKSIIQTAVNLAQGQRITVDCLPEHLRRRKFVPVRKSPSTANGSILLADVEKQHIIDVYEKMGRNKVRTARALGLGLNTLRRKLKAYHVS
ncbi:MAG: sigma-54 dependent transcriptional regulator [Desulfobacterales bacterium]|jgi:DNA-binding NtrC family response regulator|nr:sigma-54 dependent transcriptional regulator [Desulfobacterales bacterium]